MATDRPLTIVAINGSEREGNTADILTFVAKFVATRGVVVDIVNLRDSPPTPCGPCGDCNDRCTPCVLQDGVSNIVERMARADGVIFAAPVHGFGTASLMQTFIERAGVGYLRFNRPLTNKVAGVIATGRRYAHGEVWAQLTVNALLNRMIVVGSGFPSIVQALHRGDALQDVEGITNVQRMVDRMVDMMELLADHEQLTGRTLPDPSAHNERVGLPLNEPI